MLTGATGIDIGKVLDGVGLIVKHVALRVTLDHKRAGYDRLVFLHNLVHAFEDGELKLRRDALVDDVKELVVLLAYVAAKADYHGTDAPVDKVALLEGRAEVVKKREYLPVVFLYDGDEHIGKLHDRLYGREENLLLLETGVYHKRILDLRRIRPQRVRVALAHEGLQLLEHAEYLPVFGHENAYRVGILKLGVELRLVLLYELLKGQHLVWL